MTSKTKYYVELSDILAVRCECKRCRATVSIPIVRDARTNGLYSCPNCNEEWTVFTVGQNSQSVDPTIRAFINSLKSMDEAIQRTNEAQGNGGFVSHSRGSQRSGNYFFRFPRGSLVGQGIRRTHLASHFGIGEALAENMRKNALNRSPSCTRPLHFPRAPSEMEPPSPLR